MRSACVHDGVSEITEAAIKLFELPLPLSTATERVRATCLCVGVGVRARESAVAC